MTLIYFLLGAGVGGGCIGAMCWVLGLDVGLSRGRRQALTQAQDRALLCANIRLRNAYDRNLRRA